MNSVSSQRPRRGFPVLSYALRLGLCIVLAMAVAIPADAGNKRKRKKITPYNPPYAAMVMDADTGQVLFSRNADRSLHPASLTKIMTLLMVFEALDRGQLRLNDRIRISAKAASMAPSKLGVEAGETITVREAIYALVTKSCNDVAVAVAEKLSGSEQAFTRAMTKRAREIGMTRTVFYNASGLPHPKQYSSARDMALLARFVIANYPSYYRYYNTRIFNFRGQTLASHNRLMNSFDGMDGMKTGYIRASGFNLVSSATRDGRRLIGVVFGGKTANSRNEHMAEILNDGFEKLRRRGDAPPILMADASRGQGMRNEDVSSNKFKKLEPENIPNLLDQNVLDEDVLDTSAPRVSPPSATPGALAYAAVPATPAPDIQIQDIQITEAPQAAAQNSNNFSVDRFSAWAIQVGAFSSRAATDKALADSLRRLPVRYASVNPMIAPVKTSDGGWMFRARLHGLTKSEAFSACRYLSECVPVAPLGQ